MRRLALLLLPLSLAACQLAPVYSGGSTGQAQTMLSDIEVAPIPDKAGFLVRDRLVERMNPSGNPVLKLDVALDDDIIGFGVRGDNSIIRERRTLRARYRITEIATGKVLLDTSASADAGVDVVSSEYAVVAAEATALERLSKDIADQIVARLALLARSRAAE
ncbi:LPS assembly lipoprotein LptE [Sandaracinobacter sp.]|uniref:LPS assembly lipoprotein LptE n=1 Tax=Sandaracinobacter sp. TaxID=2487581 RepID=UPI0035B20EAE